MPLITHSAAATSYLRWIRGKAQEEHRLDRRLRVYLAPKVLIIDEFGIGPYDRAAATAFFTLVSARYERGSIILTSNKGFGEWGELLGDSVIAAAILDRLLHHSHVLNIRGESYRLAEKRTAGLLGGATPLPLQAVTTLSSPGNPAKDQGWVKTEPALVGQILVGVDTRAATQESTSRVLDSRQAST